ncbi:DUF1800 domain-containing protein [Chthonomonas calidirosea]|uniref:DUF1800 domain-containing protein n=1 Tax=Chthonomonas calidirosea TaxID=454171 RepID=UPI0006EC71F6|nr:DUF1800 domain-containing protein [Chthonomonas calidirosea]CEK13006.1 hypothetical protein CP488_00312 [Chthonomonas calidirosea]
MGTDVQRYHRSLKLSRREWFTRCLQAGGAASGALLLGAGCHFPTPTSLGIVAPSPQWLPPPRAARLSTDVWRVLNRAAFGPTPGLVAAVADIGIAHWLEDQLADAMPEDPYLTWHVSGLDTLQTEQDDPNELFAEPNEQLVIETGKAVLLRAIYSRHQLREVMADFWANHFNIYALKLDGRALIPTNTERVIRRHVFGRFEEMLQASARSPAMLTYLDNRDNKKGIPNENYARELMELHTVGVHSGYTQYDIMQVARCFTGWSIGSGFREAQFVFRPQWHDEGAKQVPFLHLSLPPNGGQRDGEKVLSALAHHPATAHFLAAKLCRHFLGSEPPALVERAARAYLKSDTSIRALLRPILLDGLTNADLCQPVLKRPLDLVVSALRCFAAETDAGDGLQTHLANMGQPLYQWPMPDGFPEKTSAWASALLPRWQFAFALATQGIPRTQIDLEAPLKARKGGEAQMVDIYVETVFGRPAEAQELARVRGLLHGHFRRARSAGVPDEVCKAELVALMLAAPEFQWKG